MVSEWERLFSEAEGFEKQWGCLRGPVAPFPVLTLSSRAGAVASALQAAAPSPQHRGDSLHAGAGGARE